MRASEALRPVLVAGAVFAVMFVVGLDIAHAVLLALAAVAVLQLRGLTGGQDEGWPDREDDRADAGVRREVARLSWGLSGFESRVDRRSLATLRGLAAHRLRRHGIDLDEPADAPRARQLLGEPAWTTVTSDPTSPPRFDSFARAVTAVEQLTERPTR